MSGDAVAPGSDHRHRAVAEVSASSASTARKCGRSLSCPSGKGFLYSVEELQPQIERFEEQVEAASKLQPEERTIEQRRMLRAGRAAQGVYHGRAGVSAARRLPQAADGGGDRKQIRSWPSNTWRTFGEVAAAARPSR